VRRDRGIAVEDVLPQLRSLTASASATAPTEGSQEQTTTGGFASVDFPATETSSPNGHHGYDLNGSAPYGIR
jgi:hypothetical protein